MMMLLWMNLLVFGAMGRAQSRVDLSGVDVRLCAIQIPPVLWTEKDPTNGTVLTRRGLAVDLFDYLTRALNITTSYVEIQDRDFLTNGLFRTCANALFEDELDVITIASSLSPVLYQVMDVIDTPLGAEEFRFTVPYPEEEGRIFAFYRAFTPTVWLWTLAAVIVTPVALHCLSIGYYKFVDQNCPTESVSYYVIYIATIFFYQGNCTRLRQLSFRLATGLFCLAAIVLTNGYASKMTAYLSVPKLEPIINSVQEMADSTSLKMLADTKHPLAESFLEAKSGIYKKMGDLMRASSNNVDFQHGNEEGFEKMKTGRYVLFHVDLVSLPLIHSTYIAAGRKCLFTLSKPIGFNPSFHIYVAKHWPYTRPINAQWLMLWTTGIWQFRKKEYQPNIDQCLVNRHDETESKELKPLALKDLSGAFLLLIFGLSLSLFLFLMERSWSACCH